MAIPSASRRSKLGLGAARTSSRGNDPQSSFPEQGSFVAANLDSSNTLCDTRYHRERLALRQDLRKPGRRVD